MGGVGRERHAGDACVAPTGGGWDSGGHFSLIYNLTRSKGSGGDRVYATLFLYMVRGGELVFWLCGF